MVSSANPPQHALPVSWSMPTPASLRCRSSMLMKMQKTRGLSVAPCLTPRVSGTCAVVPTALSDVKWE
eukprot:2693865-Rhodomonas_salina.1